ncbi:MAG: polyhydroxyalkanoate synthesis regulator DNA-binding domain-containing protein [Candidatus Midichloria sp.]|nr:polyhydroxyalkanoate synthesis regulator DNA-binding domain-containing protein [Candidatus Midichloria sp.]
MTDKSLLIKKYPNRRLYNTATSNYVTLENIRQLIKRGYDVEVVDVKTGEDLTKLTLIQIVLEQQQNGYELLPLEFLKQLIKLQDP